MRVGFKKKLFYEIIAQLFRLFTVAQALFSLDKRCRPYNWESFQLKHCTFPNTHPRVVVTYTYTISYHVYNCCCNVVVLLFLLLLSLQHTSPTFSIPISETLLALRYFTALQGSALSSAKPYHALLFYVRSTRILMIVIALIS